MPNKKINRTKFSIQTHSTFMTKRLPSPKSFLSEPWILLRHLNFFSHQKRLQIIPIQSKLQKRIQTGIRSEVSPEQGSREIHKLLKDPKEKPPPWLLMSQKECHHAPQEVRNQEQKLKKCRKHFWIVRKSYFWQQMTKFSKQIMQIIAIL